MTISVKVGRQTIGWFNDRLKEGKLIFRPPFQRNPVWLDKHKAYLIDTVLRELPIPEVYIQKETDAAGNTGHAVVDGQQRLRAFLGFPRGEIELMEEFSPGREGQRWDDLDDDEKKRYWNYDVATREITGGTDADLRDIFRRLNQYTVRLNAQEIRNARFKGDFIQTATEVANQKFWAAQGIFSANDIRRMLDIEYMAELLVGMLHGRQNKKQTLDAMFAKYEEGIPERQKLLSRFEVTRSLLEQLVPKLPETRWSGKSDFYSVFLALDELAQKGGSISTTRLRAAQKALETLGDEVGLRLSKDGSSRRVSKRAAAYAEAVERAASDKDRREARHQILVEVLRPFFRR